MKPEMLDADRVRLRLFRADDVDDLVAAGNDPVIRRFVGDLPVPYTAADARSWTTVGAPAVWASGGAVYAVVDPATDRLLGSVWVDRVVPSRAQAEIGGFVTPGARGRGVATAAVRALARHAFATGLVRLELLTELTNVVGQRVAGAAGFRREGVREAAGVARDGGRHDLVAWIQLAGDPDSPSSRLLPDLPAGRLTDGVATLRPLGPGDREFLWDLHTHPEVAAAQLSPMSSSRAWVERRCDLAMANWLAGERADLIIEDTATGTSAGKCALYYEDPQTRQAMVGYSLLPDWRGRGLATRAVRLLAGWAFTSAGVARLSAGTRAGNVASQRVLTRAGFRQEGQLRNRFVGIGVEHSEDLLFGLLPDDLARDDRDRHRQLSGDQ